MSEKFLSLKLVEELYLNAKLQFMFKAKGTFYYLIPNQQVYGSHNEMLAINEKTGSPELIVFSEIDTIFVDGQRVFEKWHKRLI